MSLKTFDLNLLRTLDALLEEGGVTRAGESLGRSQPAVSNALRRLRDALGDDLLVRGAGGYVLTPRAESLRGPLRDAMALLRSCLFEDAPFDPEKAEGLFRVSMPDRLTLAIVPPLLARLRDLAPGMDLQVATADRRQALDLLDGQRVDVALGWLDDPPPHLRTEALGAEYLYCVFREAHPLARPGATFDIAGVLSYPHVVVSATGERTAIFDDLLARRGLARRAVVSVQNFTVVPRLLATSDMIGVFTRLASDVFESSFGLAKRKAPVDVGKIETVMAWQTRLDGDRAQVWLRQQVRSVYAGL